MEEPPVQVQGLPPFLQAIRPNPEDQGGAGQKTDKAD